jgi:hypothetical protein
MKNEEFRVKNDEFRMENEDEKSLLHSSSFFIRTSSLPHSRPSHPNGREPAAEDAAADGSAKKFSFA